MARAQRPAPALVKLASDEDIRALAVQQPVSIIKTVSSTTLPWWHGDGLVYMRRDDGGFVAVGRLKQVEFVAKFDTAHCYNGEVTAVPGLLEGRIFFDGRIE